MFNCKVTEKNYFNIKTVELVITKLLLINPDTVMFIKSIIPFRYAESIKEKFDTSNVIFNPEFLSEGKALYDNL